MVADRRPPQRRLPAREERIDRLVEAARAELREESYEAFTVRKAARRAGVAPATAYTYFASKDHLVAETFRRHIEEVPLATSRRRRASGRVSVALGDLARHIAVEPGLAAAATTAVLAADPGVARLRGEIGAAFVARIAAALGPDATPARTRTLNLVVAGALINAGMGWLAYDDLPAVLDEAARVVLADEHT